MYLLAAGFFLAACSEDSSMPAPSPNEPGTGPFAEGIFVVNEGQFGQNNGEISLIDLEEGTVRLALFEEVNNRPFAGLIQSMVDHDALTYLVANTGKVEIVNRDDFESVGAVEADLDLPRSLTVAGGNLYISDWGPFDANFGSPDSYIAVVEGLTGGAVARKIPVPSRPGKMLLRGNQLLIAAEAAGRIVVLDLATEEIREVEVEGAPRDFITHNGGLMVFARSGSTIFLHELNSSIFQVIASHRIELENATSIFDVHENTLYVGANEPFPATGSLVAAINLNSRQVTNPSFYTGENLYGLSVNPANGEVWVTDAAGFQGNGQVFRLDAQGTLLDTFDVGAGPNGLVFR
ncbi:hypothetical protein A3SI_01451 [Nitritalea halalkaliphila LW7]|uniref:Surface layer protein n=2 Tax=Nitritalea TaxID=1187887 RepID=I5CA54_9BACT|nr:hypothetical protein A3SI_01451 [Nitritalea halalkaliphila LW7]